jgi:hypothetical protein
VALGLGGDGGGAAAFISRDAEKAVVELEEHAVRNLETREANTLEEPEVSGGRRAVLQVAKWISKTAFNKFSADPTPSSLRSTAHKLSETCRSDTQA